MNTTRELNRELLQLEPELEIFNLSDIGLFVFGITVDNDVCEPDPIKATSPKQVTIEDLENAVIQYHRNKRAVIKEPEW